MLSFLLAIHFILTISIIGLILLQKHDSDGALGSSGGGAASGMFSVRGQANLLTRSTAILMAIFIINCITMAKMAKHSAKKESIIDSVAQKNVASEPVGSNASIDLPATQTKKKTDSPSPSPAPVTAKTKKPAVPTPEKKSKK